MWFVNLKWYWKFPLLFIYNVLLCAVVVWLVAKTDEYQRTWDVFWPLALVLSFGYSFIGLHVFRKVK